MNPTDPPATVAAGVLQPLALALGQRGIDPAALLASYGLTPGDLARPGCRIPEDHVRGIWQQALGATGDPALGLRVGQLIEPQALGVLGYVISNAATVGQALTLFDRFNRLIFDEHLFRVSTARAAGLSCLQLRRPPGTDPELSRPTTEFIISALIRIAGFLASEHPQHNRRLRRISLRHRQPADAVLASYRNFFGEADLRFSQPENVVSFDRVFLAEPVAYADPQMLVLMKRQADQQLRALATETDIVAKVTASIRRRLVGSAPSIQAVAADCNVSRATLQRRLQAARTSFRALLDQVRFELASDMLIEEHTTLEEIGFVLGYSEPAAFQHAFRRWSGRSPGAQRRLLRG